MIGVGNDIIKYFVKKYDLLLINLTPEEQKVRDRLIELESELEAKRVEIQTWDKSKEGKLRLKLNRKTPIPATDTARLSASSVHGPFSPDASPVPGASTNLANNSFAPAALSVPGPTGYRVSSVPRLSDNRATSATGALTNPTHASLTPAASSAPGPFNPAASPVPGPSAYRTSSAPGTSAPAASLVRSPFNSAASSARSLFAHDASLAPGPVTPASSV